MKVKAMMSNPIASNKFPTLSSEANNTKRCGLKDMEFSKQATNYIKINIVVKVLCVMIDK